MQVLPQALINAKVPNDRKSSYMDYSEVADAIKRLEDKFAGEGRVLIRPSGTEPLVRVMIEGKNQNEIETDARQLADLIERVMA
jgi:phosphoglucosamine mutase